MHATTVYTADDGTSRSSRANLQTGAIFNLPRGAVTEIPDMSVEIARRTRACWMRIRRYLRELYDQPKVALSLKIRMVKAEATAALLSVWMQYVDPPSGTLRQTPHRTPPGLAFVLSGTAQEIRPSDDLVQPYPRDNPVRKH